MIKLCIREMKNLSRILTMMLCFAPLCANAAGTVATTSGSNLTAFNPSNANNNQWASMTNGRYDTNTAAKVDFGNCNAVVLRCAQPKCANGGCSDMSIASAIVAGCVQSNDTCKQYGNDLVQYMSAQLVASSTAKINEQNAAAQQAAAAAAAQQSQQQMQEMQYQMQQMQQQMAQQQAESAAQLQNALAQQAAQNAAALESVKSAATDAAKENEAGISAYQQDAINRGISTDVLERQKITGQVMTELENAEVQMKTLKTVMNTAFEYAGCDARGNNCTGPKRVKKWRELATEFLDPYDEVINKTYDALELAILVGVNLSDIYMMLNNSCNRWGQYMCPRVSGGKIEYTDIDSSYKGIPQVCTGGFKPDSECVDMCWEKNSCNQDGCVDGNTSAYNSCINKCSYKKSGTNCRPCTLLKILSNDNEVYEGWIDAEGDTSNGNTTVVACASGALDASALFRRRTKNKNGAGLVDIDKLDTWLHQKEPSKELRSGVKPLDYCDADDNKDILEKAMLSKVVPVKGSALCVEKIEAGKRDYTKEDSDCGYINPTYAICDIHPYNVGKSGASDEIKKRFPNDCTDELQKTDPNVLWAEKDSQGNCTIVKWCKEGYKSNGRVCSQLISDDGKASWKIGVVAYDQGLKEYNEHMNTKLGEIKEMLALKTTVISQQMYKQYEYLSATLRRLKTQLEKATLTAQLQAAGAKDDDSSSSSGLLGSSSSKSSQYRNCAGKDDASAVECFSENYSVLWDRTKEGKKCNNKDDKSQIEKDIKIMNALLSDTRQVAKEKDKKLCDTVDNTNCDDCLNHYTAGINNLRRQIKDDEAARNRRY